MRELAQTLTFPGGTLSGGNWAPGTQTINGPAASSLNSLGAIISRALPYIILLAGVGTLLMILAAGFQLITGANDPKQLDMGRKRLTYGIVGFFVVFLSFWVVQAVGIIFGISEFACVFGSFGGLTCP